MGTMAANKAKYKKNLMPSVPSHKVKIRKFKNMQKLIYIINSYLYENAKDCI